MLRLKVIFSEEYVIGNCRLSGGLLEGSEALPISPLLRGTKDQVYKRPQVP